MPSFDVADLVRRARLDAGLTQAELARRAGTSQSAVAATERGVRTPSPDAVRRLLDAAGLRPSIPLTLHAEEIRRLAPRHGLDNVRVFGSVFRSDDGAESDIDLLAHYDPESGVGFFAMMSFASTVAELVGFPVDLVLDDSDAPSMAKIRQAAVPR